MDGESATGTCSTDVGNFCVRCNSRRNTPFCPVCGEPLTANRFIGQTLQQLQAEGEDAGRTYRYASERISDFQRRYDADMKPLKESLDKASAVCQAIREAIDWARRNDIQHPNVRRD